MSCGGGHLEFHTKTYISYFPRNIPVIAVFKKNIKSQTFIVSLGSIMFLVSEKNYYFVVLADIIEMKNNEV
jgi:hypothetical protein